MHEIYNNIGLVQSHCTMQQFKQDSGYSKTIKYVSCAGGEKLIKAVRA